MEPVSLLKITLDGNIVAEAELRVYDQAGAWKTFVNCFPAFAHLITGEVFATMHVACDDELRAKTPQTGLLLEMDTKLRPHIVVPQNGALPK